MEIPSKEDLQATENRLINKINSLEEHIKTLKPAKRWLKSKEFMELFDIKHKDSLIKLRNTGQVKAKMKLSEWYYDKDSFLPS